MDTIARIDAFFAGKPEAWALFEALYFRLLDAYPKVQLRVMKTCISLDDPKPFVYVSFPRKRALQGCG